MSDFNKLNWGDFITGPQSKSGLENIPDATGDIPKIMIMDKLKSMGFSLGDFNLGMFDQIGEYTAKKTRDPSSELYKSVGCFFRPNYERGILIYALIKKYNIRSFLEIGFGRGYGTMCAAMAMNENGYGEITTVDPNFNKKHIEMISQVFPKEFMSRITMVQETSHAFLQSKEVKDEYDFIYIDGDHTYDAVKKDWELTKDRYQKLLLFDDYHLPSKDSGAGIQCSNLIDQIEDNSKELIIMDRRIFFDDRRYTDDQIDYGQVLLTR